MTIAKAINAVQVFISIYLTGILTIGLLFDFQSSDDTIFFYKMIWPFVPEYIMTASWGVLLISVLL